MPGSELTAAAVGGAAADRRPRIAWFWWPIWMTLLALGLIVFYGVFTPGWMLARLVAWLSERRPRAAGGSR